jgi:predicted nucleotidyltransferase component of viral defense system
MDPRNPYFEQVRLLVEILPVLARRTEYALKGGTAINLFFRDMPRLSVDVDLVYLIRQDRKKCLSVIDASLAALSDELGKGASGMQVIPRFPAGTDKRDKLIIRRKEAEVKVEVSTVLREAVFPAEVRSVRPMVEKAFGPAEMQVLQFEEVFAGKLCAALDRQHPRDLFDVRLLLEGEGITPRLKDAFLVYLLSNPKPIVEMLDPKAKDISRTYEMEFAGMSVLPVPLEQLLEARSRMIREIHLALTGLDREFLIRFKRGVPDWSALPIPGVESLPAIRWKVYNLERMTRAKREQAADKLARILSHGPTWH